jgi:hypothetical protein
MLPGGLFAHDVKNLPAVDGQRVGDEGTMATPGHSFSAHDGGLSRTGQFFGFVKNNASYDYLA